MTEHDKRRKLNKCIRKILMVSTMITVTVIIVSLLYIQSGRADRNISVAVVPANHTENSGGRIERYSGEVLVVTTSRITIPEMNVTDRPAAEQIQDELITTSQGLQTPEVTRRPELNTDSTAKLLRVNSSRSLDDDVVRGNSFEVTPFMINTSTVTTQPLVLARENMRVNNNNLYLTNHHFYDNNTTIGNDDEKYELKKITQKDLHPANNREVKHNKMVHDGQLITGTNNIMAKKSASTSHLKLYDLPYKMHDYSNTEDDISTDGIGWNTIDEPKNTYPTTSWAGGTGTWDQPPHETGNYGYSYNSQPNRVTKDRRRPIQQKENKIDWHTIGILAFIKLGLAKLQAIGFLNILFLIMFKLKLYMIAVFIKFLLIIKLMKLSKILILPLLFLQLLPTMMQLLPMRSSNNNMMNLPGTTQTNQPGGLIPSQSSNILPGGTTGLLRPGGETGTGLTGGGIGTGLSGGGIGTGLTGGGIGTGLTGGGPGTGLTGGGIGTGLTGGGTGGIRPGGLTGGIRSGGTTGISQTKRLSSFKFDDLNLISKQKNESSILFDPSWEIFQKILDSEKCIERIACQMSVTEKAGIMPFWINWIIYNVSTFIPSDKLVSYLKTYKNVNNDILNNSTSIENWTTWCSERYKCNSTNNLSNVMNTK